MKKSIAPFWLGVQALALSACGATSGEGELGYDLFRYACVERSDAACDELGAGVKPVVLEAVPVLVKGGVFRLVTEDPWNTAVSPTGRIAPIEGEHGTFRAEIPGYAAIFSIDKNNNLVDFFHLTVVEPAAALLLFRQGPSVWVKPGGTLTVPVGSSAELRVVPIDAKGNMLAGSLAVVWTSMPPELLGAVATKDGNVLLIAPTEPLVGELLVSVAGGLKAQVNFIASQGGTR